MEEGGGGKRGKQTHLHIIHMHVQYVLYYWSCYVYIYVHCTCTVSAPTNWSKGKFLGSGAFGQVCYYCYIVNTC